MFPKFKKNVGLTTIPKIFLSCFLVVCLFPLKASAQYEFKLKVNHNELLQHLLGNVDEIRVAFLDLSDPDSIFLTEISLDGDVTSRVKLLPNTLSIEENVREAIHYNKITDSYFLGWHGKGVFEFDRSGKQINFIKTPPLTHDIYVDENRTMTFAHSWSNENEPQAYQVDSSGEVIWQWNAKKFIKSNKFKNAVNRKEPDNFAAATSAVPIGNDKIAVTLSAWNVIAIVDKKSKKVVDYITDTRRPHSVVTDEESVIGYTSRSLSGNFKKHGPGNSLVVFDESKQLFSRSFADGVKSLDLQHIGNGLWLLPNGPSIKIMDSEGIVYWQLDIDNYILLDSARFSFTNAVMIGNDNKYQRPKETYRDPSTDAVCKFRITQGKSDKRNRGKEIARLVAGFVEQQGSDVSFFIQTGWGFKKKRSDLLENKHQLKIQGNVLSGSMMVFTKYEDVEDKTTEPTKGTLTAKLRNGLLQNGNFELTAKSGYSTKKMVFTLSECNTK